MACHPHLTTLTGPLTQHLIPVDINNTPGQLYNDNHGAYDYNALAENGVAGGSHYTRRHKQGLFGWFGPSEESMKGAAKYIQNHFNVMANSTTDDGFLDPTEIENEAASLRSKGNDRLAKALEEWAQYVPQLMMAHISTREEAWNGLGKHDIDVVINHLNTNGNSVNSLLQQTYGLQPLGDDAYQVRA